MPDSLTSDDMWPLQPKAQAKKVELDDAEIDSADEMPAASAPKAPAKSAAPAKPVGKPAGVGGSSGGRPAVSQPAPAKPPASKPAPTASKPAARQQTASSEAPTKPVLRAVRPPAKEAIPADTGEDDITVPITPSSGTGATGAFRAASATRNQRSGPKPEFAEFRSALLEEAERVRKSGIDHETALVVATKLRRLANEVYHLGKALGYL